MMTVKLYGWLVVASSLMLLQASESRAQKVHAIVACDTSAEADLGGDVVADMAAVQMLLKENVPPSQLNLQTITGDELSPDSVLRRIASLRVEQRRDAIVFYYTGHGAFDSKKGHFFSMPHRKQMLRKDLELALIAKRPRTAVTITDCCAAGSRFRGKSVPMTSAKAASRMSPLFNSLLFERCGLVSVTSSKPGEVSLTRGDGKGSLFTYPFVKYMSVHAGSRLDWDTVLASVTKSVAADFTRVTDGQGVDKDRDGKVDQWSQTVHPFVRTPALGMWGEEHPDGIRITGVIPLSPAFHVGLEVDDVVLQINGSPIRTQRQYSAAVDRSPKQMRMLVRNHRQPRGKPIEVVAELNR